jgi:hypothetical protein
LIMGRVMQDRGNDAITEQDDLIDVIFGSHRDFSY